MQQDAPARARFAVLDSWRGLAACMVALHHLRVPSHLGDAAMVRNASLFVDFFFVLSGFVIAASYAQRLAGGFGLWRFMLLRFGRVYPLHLCMLLAFLALGGAPLATPEGSFGFVSHLLLLHGVGVTTPVWGNVPSWSISTECFVYLIFAGLLSALRSRAAWALALAVVVLPTVIYAGAGNLPDANGYQLLRGLYGFSAGALAWPLYRWLRERIGVSTAAEVLSVSALAGFISAAGSGAVSILAPLVFAGVVVVFAFEAGAASRLLACRPLLWLGTVSYSVYMVHYFVAGRMAHAVAVAQAAGVPLHRFLGVDKWAGDLALLVYLAVVFALAGLAYRWIEAPSRAWFRQIAGHALPTRAAA